MGRNATEQLKGLRPLFLLFFLPIVFWRSFPPTAVVDIQPAGPTDEPQTRNSGLLPRTLAEMILAARETLGGHTSSGPLPRVLPELILAARETLGGHMNSGLLSRALAELILAARSNEKSVLHRLHIRPILHILPNV